MAQKKKTPGAKPKQDDTDETGADDSTDDTSDDTEDNSEEENRRINAIVTSRVKREMKQVNATLQAIQESLKGLSQPKQEDAEHDDDAEETTVITKKDATVDPKLAKKMSRLEKELADEKAERVKAQRERAEEQEKAKKQELRNSFQAALTEHGVTDPRLMRAALSQLEEDGYMIRDEDGKAKFKGVDKYGIETNFDPKSGVKNWITSEGKSFVPAVEASGSGGGGSRAATTTTNLSKGEFGKLSPQQKAAIELERASTGLPPLE